MNTYNAKAEREGRFWVVDVQGVGLTQGRSLVEAKAMAVDLVAVMRGVDPSEVAVDMTVVLPTELQTKVGEVKQSRTDLESMQRRVGEVSRGLVQSLRAAGLTGKDVAAVLEVSEQRVSQLVTPAVAAGRRTASALGNSPKISKTTSSSVRRQTKTQSRAVASTSDTPQKITPRSVSSSQPR